MDIESLDFQNLKCNCKLEDTPPNDKCPYNDICRRSVVVYQAECDLTGDVYIGSTHQHLKTRMQQHNKQAIRCHKTGTSATSFARYFGTFFQNFEVLSPRLIRNSINYSILYQGNPLSVVQTFGTPNCRLCSKERIEILKRSRHKPQSLINKRQELYEACKHKPQFHRYKVEEASTDETSNSRKSQSAARSNHRVLISV